MRLVIAILLLASALHAANVAGGQDFTLVVKADGTLWGVGYNDSGALCTGDRNNVGTLTQIGALTTWEYVNPGFFHTLAIKTDGTLWACGTNTYGQTGQGSSGGYTLTLSQIGSDNKWVEVGGGYYFSAGLKSDGTIWAWGDNQYGQLGDGTTTERDSPVQVGTDTHWVAISVGGYHVLALKDNGTLWAWGRNSYGTNEGQLGDGTATNRSSPVQIGTYHDWRKVYAGWIHSGAIKADGTFWIWGGNHQGELCSGDYTSVLAPAKLGSVNTWVSAALKNDTTHLLKADGTLWGCGSNVHGQLGDGTNNDSLTLKQIGTDTDWRSIGPSHLYYTVGEKWTGDMWAWGDDTYGQLADGTTTETNEPADIVNIATTYTVGAGAEDYSTIQDCSTNVPAGGTCLISAGTYNEHVTTPTAGTGEHNRITYRAVPGDTVTMQGFDVTKAYLTIEDLTIAPYTTNFAGMIDVFQNADHLQVLNNTISGTYSTYQISGVQFERSSGNSADYALIRGNLIDGINGYGVVIRGTGAMIEDNEFTASQQWDFINFFGTDHIIQRNYIHDAGCSDSGAGCPPGNHPDFAQTFSSDSEDVDNIMIRENFMPDLPSQLCQMNSSVNGEDLLVSNMANITLDHNVFANVPLNCNADVPYITWTSNTFYKMATTQSGINLSGSWTRGESPHQTFRNNVFLEGGSNPTSATDGQGFYNVDGFLLTREVIAKIVTGEDTSDCPTTCPDAAGIATDMIANSYIDGATNGHILAAARSLATIDDFQLNASYAAYKTDLWNTLEDSISRDNSVSSTFSADYDFAAGAEVATPPFIAKKSSGCNCSNTFTNGNFCEAVCGNGINGGDPKFADLTDLVGPDGIPWTLDDGLKPASDSPLCSAGYGGVDIGAYSCSAGVVLSGEIPSSQPVGSIRTGPVTVRNAVWR